MSKIFKISGVFTRDGSWVEPDPAFEGEIVVNDAGKFYGWCEQFCLEGSESNEVKEFDGFNKTRYLIGALAEEFGGYSVALFKLANVEWQAPIFYETHDVSSADSIWAAKDPGGCFVPYGNARISLTKLPFSENAAVRIKNRFSEANISINENDDLLREVESWREKTLVLWA